MMTHTLKSSSQSHLLRNALVAGTIVS